MTALSDYADLRARVDELEREVRNLENTESLQPNIINITPAGAVEPIYLSIAQAPFIPVGPTVTAEAINAAIASLPTNGGNIVLPAGSFPMDQPIVADGRLNVGILGAGSRYGGTQLQTASLTNDIISARSTGGFKLNGIALNPTNANYSGTLLRLARAPAGPIDTGLFHIWDCAFQGQQNAGQTGYGINLQKSISGTIEGCKFSGGLNAIRGLFVAGDYCNAHTIRENFFQYSAATPIVDLGGGCVLGPGNTFEPLLNGNAGAYFQDASLPAAGLLIFGNWTGDAPAHTGTWFTVAGEGISLLSNPQITSGNTGILTSGNCSGLVVIGNTFSGLLAALDTTVGSHDRVVYLGNHEDNITTPLPTTNNWGEQSLASQHNFLASYGDLVADQASGTRVRIGNSGGGAAIIYFGAGEDTSLYRKGAAAAAFNGFLTIGDSGTGCLINGNAANESGAATAGTAVALPAKPQGYLLFQDHNGNNRMIPYYNP